MEDPRKGLSRREALLLGGTAVSMLAAPSIARGQAAPEGQPTILITGSSSGIGRDTALRFAREGWRVLASMRESAGRNAEAARSLIAEAQAAGGLIDVIEIDVDSDASVETGMAHVAELTGGRIDVLVNNAAIMIPMPVELVSQASMERSFNTNLYGQQRVVRAVAPLMRARNYGVIVNISSGLGIIAMPIVGTYAATKHAMEAWSDALRHEVIPYGIDVVAVQPRDTDTPFMANAQRYYREEMDQIATASERYQAYNEYLPVVEALMAYRNPDPVSRVSGAVYDLAVTPHGERPSRISMNAGPYEQVNGIREAVRQQVVSSTPLTDWVSL